MERAQRVEHLLGETRRADPDRYLCALFAPAERREALLSLVLLDAELARVPASVSQPMLGLIRYQWWRDAIAAAAAGRPREHPVVEGLATGLGQGAYAEGALVALVDAREPELEGPPPTTLPAAEARQGATSGALQELAAACLGAGEGSPERRAARMVGTALGLARLARAVPSRAERAPLTERALALLAEARAEAPRPPRRLAAAFLPARLVRAYARRLRSAGDGEPVERPPLAVLGLVAASLARRF